jgi:DnaK suppressor protein
VDQSADASGIDLVWLSSALAAKRAEIEAELDLMSRLTADLGSGQEARSGEGTSVAVERLTQVAAYDRVGLLLSDVIRAQVKITDGTVGHCDRCGEVIQASRLQALPWATRCVTCPAAY